MSSTNDMTKDVPIKVIIRFSIPLLIGTLFQQAYNIIDTMIAGYNLGDDAIAAIGTTYPFTNFWCKGYGENEESSCNYDYIKYYYYTAFDCYGIAIFANFVEMAGHTAGNF